MELWKYRDENGNLWFGELQELVDTFGCDPHECEGCDPHECEEGGWNPTPCEE
jgi:hypothetical protein